MLLSEFCDRLRAYPRLSRYIDRALKVTLGQHLSARSRCIDASKV